MSFLKKMFNVQQSLSLTKNEDPDVIVKKIHNEVDSLEQQVINAVEQMLAEIKIPTETKVVEKAKLMESLGFGINNQTVKESLELREQIQSKTQLKKETEVKLHYIDYLRKKYPNDKIVPMSEFQKVLTKYNLIYAPSSAYIKDVPEKNLLEIQNAKDTKYEDEAFSFKFVTKLNLYYGFSQNLATKISKLNLKDLILNKVRKEVYFYGFLSKFDEERFKDLEQQQRVAYTELWTKWVEDDVRNRYENANYSYQGSKKIVKYDFSNTLESIEIIAKQIQLQLPEYSLKEIDRCISIEDTCTVKRNFLFIAAPKTHFDLTGMSTYDGKEYYLEQKVQITEIKDPIAFYIMKGSEENPNEEFVRIVSKWGTSDDKSYLDPIVQNETLN